eukprot:Colp12_sorted_trinity150504_noHs@27382
MDSPSSDSTVGTKIQTKKGWQHRIRLSEGCRNAEIFFGLAVLQAVVIIALQVTILGIGDFSATGLGEDRKVYAVIYIVSVLYSVGFALDALQHDRENIMQLGAYVVLNLTYVLYGVTQVYQFRHTSEFRTSWQAVDFLAVVSLCILSVLTIVFIVYWRRLYMNFGWIIFKKIGASSKVQAMYRVYQLFVMSNKVLGLILVAFFTLHCAVLLSNNTSDPEFAINIICCVYVPFIVWVGFRAVRYEQYIWTLYFYYFNLVGGMCYFAFKVYRFSTKTCPLCIQVIKEDPTGRHSFVFLTLFSVVNLVMLSFTLVLALLCHRNFGNDLPTNVSRITDTRTDPNDRIFSSTSINKI